MRVVVVVVWPSGWKHEAREGVWAKNPKPSMGLDFCETMCRGVRFGLWGVDWGG